MTGCSEPQPLYQVQNCQSELPPLYQVQNWSVRTPTSLPSSELVSQNSHLFTKFRTGQSELPPLYQVQNCQSELPPLYQVQNWSVRTPTSLPSSELVSQNLYQPQIDRTGQSEPQLFSKFRTGQSEVCLVRPATWQQNTCCRPAHCAVTSGVSSDRWKLQW